MAYKCKKLKVTSCGWH